MEFHLKKFLMNHEQRPKNSFLKGSHSSLLANVSLCVCVLREHKTKNFKKSIPSSDSKETCNHAIKKAFIYYLISKRKNYYVVHSRVQNDKWDRGFIRLCGLAGEEERL